MTITEADVVLVGFGPGGQVLAALLGQRGVSTIAFERRPEPYNLPRAGHIDHEVVRTVQALGQGQALEAELWKVAGDYVYVNGQYEVLMTHPVELEEQSVSGWHSDYTLYQPVLEDAIRASLDPAHVEVAMGWEVTGLSSAEDHVEVRAAEVAYVDGRKVASGADRIVRARYVVAADGASSSVRASLDIAQLDLGFDERFLDVDMATVKPHVFDPNLAQVCDPKRPRMLIPLGPKHRRFEWALRPDDSVQHMEDPATAWTLLQEWDVTPDNHRIVRQVVYQFQARMAERWRDGRILLLGDAAHTMPPFAGQGLCSAIRDSANLAWKLALVLDGTAPDSLLDTYEVERRPHVEAWTLVSIAEGKVNCEWDEDAARLRDDRFRSGWLPPMPVIPDMRTGVVATAGPNAGRPPTGSLCVQALVNHAGSVGLLEDLIPRYRFNVIAFGWDPRTDLGPEELTLIDLLNATVVPMGGEDDVGAAYVDVTGAYREWFDQHEVVAVIERPDFYVFGACGKPEELGPLLRQLAQMIGISADAGVGAMSSKTRAGRG